MANGLSNTIAIVAIIIMLIVFAFIFSIGDIIMNGIHAATFSYPTAEKTFQSYGHLRDFFMSLCFNIALPFIIFTLFLSSFVNRNQNILVYTIQTFVIVMATPLVLFATADLVTNLANIPIINPAYLQSLYISNILTIMVVNMLLSIASFVFVQRSLTNVA